MNYDDDVVTFAGTGLNRARERAICEALGIDPEHTTSVVVQVDPSGRFVEWSGRRRVSADELRSVTLALQAVETGDES